MRSDGCGGGYYQGEEKARREKVKEGSLINAIKLIHPIPAPLLISIRSSLASSLPSSERNAPNSQFSHPPNSRLASPAAFACFYCLLPGRACGRNLMDSDASTSPRRRSCYSDSGDSSCSEPFSECGSDDLSSFSPAAAAGIHRLLLSCAAEASDGSISSLVAELESPAASVDSLRRAAMEIRLLAKHNPDNRIRIAASGAVRPLVALLSHADPLLQEHGVTALLNLSICDENKAAIVEAGAIRPLVRALKSAASPAARENAACALLRLSQLDGAAAAAVGRAGAIPLLVSLLETGGARGKKDAATALYAVCNGARENRLRAVEAGAVRPLLDLMSDPESGMVDKAAYVLHSLVGFAEGRSAAVEEGGIPVLVEMVEVGTSRQKEIATLSLLQICDDNAAYRTMVAREGAIPPLVALSQSSSARPKLKTKVLLPVTHFLIETQTLSPILITN